MILGSLLKLYSIILLFSLSYTWMNIPVKSKIISGIERLNSKSEVREKVWTHISFSSVKLWISTVKHYYFSIVIVISFTAHANRLDNRDEFNLARKLIISTTFSLSAPAKLDTHRALWVFIANKLKHFVILRVDGKNRKLLNIILFMCRLPFEELLFIFLFLCLSYTFIHHFH